MGVAKEGLGEVSSDSGLFLLVECIHTPYCQLLVRYSSMETQVLKHNLHKVDLVSQSEDLMR